MEPLMTTEEVAEFLKVDVVTVRRLVNRGELSAYRVGGEYRFRASIIESYLQRQYVSKRDERGDRFAKFTNRARTVLEMAQEEAVQLQHPFIGTEHILLGLLSEGEGVAAQVLHKLDVDLDTARERVNNIILSARGGAKGAIKETIASLKKATMKSTPSEQGEIGLTPRAKKVIHLAIDEAKRMGDMYVGTEHLLLGLIREGEGIGAGVLESFGVDLKKARKLTMEVLDREASTVVESEEFAAKDTRWSKGRFDKFTKRARIVLDLAQEEARQFQHNYIGTEHLLLGLISEGEGVAAQVLRDLDIELDAVRRKVESIIGHGDHIVLGEVGLTPRAKKVMELAVDEARRMNHHYIGTEHLLLGLIREGDGVAADVLNSFGVKLEQVRKSTIHILNTPNAPKPTTPSPVPDEATSLLAEGTEGHTCSRCGVKSPTYFRYCFNCGNRLEA